jgi:ABC-type nitrate/sulfonate/bicarbonate transport system permease component
MGAAMARLSVLPFLALLIIWEAVARSGLFTAFVLPSASTVMLRIWADAGTGELFIHLGVTLYRALIGFLIAAVLGILLGLMITRVALVRWFFEPIISIGFPMPKIVFLPIVTLWLGFDDTLKITMVVVDAVFPVVTATIAGVAGVEKELTWSARSLGANQRQMVREVLFPAALPQIMTGLQVALPVALIVCVVAEMLTGGNGLGGAMLGASRVADSPGIFAGIVEIAVAGYVLVQGMSAIRSKVLAWHPEALPPATV